MRTRFAASITALALGGCGMFEWRHGITQRSTTAGPRDHRAGHQRPRDCGACQSHDLRRVVAHCGSAPR